MSLLPAKYAFTIWEGATWRKTITVLTGAEGSTPRDFTGFTGVMTIRTAPDTTPVYTLSTTNGQITLGGVLGTVALYIPATDTQTFTWKSGIYELSLTDGNSGDIEAVLWGRFTVQGIG